VDTKGHDMSDDTPQGPVPGTCQLCGEAEPYMCQTCSDCLRQGDQGVIGDLNKRIAELEAERTPLAHQIIGILTRPPEPRTFAPLLEWAQATLQEGESA